MKHKAVNPGPDQHFSSFHHFWKVARDLKVTLILKSIFEKNTCKSFEILSTSLATEQMNHECGLPHSFT